VSFLEDATAAGMAVPDYGGLELGAVLPASLAAIGAGHVVRGRDAEADRVRLGIPEARHVCTVIVDGLGRAQLDARAGHARFLAGLSGPTATAGYPTTTAASLALFGTGQTSGQTGMTGYTVRNPRTGKLANLISWDGAEPAEDWQRQPSLLEQASLGGVQVTTLGKARFAGSGLTHAVLRGGQFVGAERLADRIDVALGAMRSPGVSYMYWGEVDGAGHAFGWQSDEWVGALEDADRELARLASSMPAGSALVITADHGMVDVTGAPRWDVGEDDVLAEGVTFVAGEPRALHLYAEEPEAVAARWREELAAQAVVATRDDAVAAGIFGDVADDVVERIGDVVVAMAGRATVVDSRIQTPASMSLIGVHGSLTPDELYVPVLIEARG